MSILIGLIIAIVVVAVVLKVIPLLNLGEPWGNILTIVVIAALVIWLLQRFF